MSVNLVFVDGTLSTGSNNGTNWENAYQGTAGLQTALDNVSYSQGTHTYILLRNTFTLTATIDVDVWNGSFYKNTWLRIIGCENTDMGTNYTPLPVGQYVEIVSSGYIDGITFYTIGECISFENIWVHGALYRSGFMGKGITGSSKYSYNWKNVKITDCQYAINFGFASTSERFFAVNLYDCVFKELSSHTIYANCYAYIEAMFNCYVEIAAGCQFWYPAVIYAQYYGISTAINCIFIGGTRVASGRTFRSIVNNVFYKQTSDVFKAIYIAGGAEYGTFINNICYLDMATRPVIDLMDGSNMAGSIHYCNYNATNSTTADKWGQYTDGACDLSSNIQLTSSPFVDADNGDFRILQNSPLLNTGKQTNGGDNIKGYSSIGSWQRKVQIISKARPANFSRMAIMK